MKVKLLKPFGSHKKGSIMTMAPVNARVFAKQGVCKALTENEQAYLDAGIVRRGRRVETQVEAHATETTDAQPTKDIDPEPVLVLKKRGGRRKGSKSQQVKGVTA
jgi:hypothetical protein